MKNSVKVGNVSFGNGKIGLIAGPCAIESYEQLEESARILSSLGVKILRASAFKPRTNPNAFQGIGRKGIDMLSEIGKKYALLTETEVMDIREVEYCSDKIDVLRVGARNMQNYDLLKELNKIDNPIILKNGLASTYDEFIGASEYLTQGEKTNVILCWRGIRTFEQSPRFNIDMLAIEILKQKSKLPIIIDPSHPAGKKEYVLPLSKTAIASGADGLIVETHPNPKEAKCDAEQQLPLNEFENYLNEIKLFSKAIGKEIV
jgi:3-deoxy-7-phosphoheptulonate synthase